VKADFLEGKSITGQDFLLLCKQAGIAVPIRTIGTIRKSVIRLNIEGEINYRKQGKKRAPDFTGCWKVICEYKNMNHKDAPG